VALLERGTGGVPEVRNAIDNYEEISPLYGFLQYRRRKVILRYMPEGLSRLILGTSTAVSFTSRIVLTDTLGSFSAKQRPVFICS
jgi:hypothetical protein